MPTYAIGDVQGCFTALQQLLEKVKFDPQNDYLWFTGDLVNRGPQSLETLRFVKSLGDKAITVLGNHDLTLLAVGFGVVAYNPQHHTFKDILGAPDKMDLLNWLRVQPLLHYNDECGYLLVHAGIHPRWDFPLAKSLAHEVEAELRGPNFLEFLSNMYGNAPDSWDHTLTGWNRLRFIVNCFTQLRFCTPLGKIDLTTKGSVHHAPAGYFPWFSIHNRLNENLKIIFGHWASLKGECSTPNIFALDTGCVWGNALTALCLESSKRTKIPCHKMTNNQIRS